MGVLQAEGKNKFFACGEMPRKRCISFLYSFGHEENQDEEDIGNDDGSSFNREHDIPCDGRGVCF